MKTEKHQLMLRLRPEDFQFLKKEADKLDIGVSTLVKSKVLKFKNTTNENQNRLEYSNEQ